MTQYIPKDALIAGIKRRMKNLAHAMSKFYFASNYKEWKSVFDEYKRLISFLNTLEVIDPYKQCIQYPSVKDGIEAHAETYSFNIESELFNQLTKEQQALWRKEIEYACISGGEMGVELARDPRYKENLKTKDALIEKAEKYLLKHLIDYWSQVVTDESGFIEGFKKYMKGE